MIHKLLANRIIKIIANMTKLICHVIYFVSPKMRMTIPKSSARRSNSPHTTKIPHILWQTNYTARVTLAVYINYLFNRLLSPTFEYRFMTTEDRADFIKSNYPRELYERYSSIQIGAAQADFWRVLVLQKYGGVYLDIDAHFIWPLHRIIKPEFDELYVVSKRGTLNNYFIASKKDNVHLGEIIDHIHKNIADNTLKNVFDLTGPGVFNQVIDKKTVPTTFYRYTCTQGDFTNDFFQYVDKPEGKWTKAQQKMDIIKE